jgi:hypothetical protein
MAYGTINAEQLTTQSGYTLGAGNASSFKNRILNGGMVIDQRNAGASVTPTSTGSSTYLLDRWKADISQASKFSVQQSSTAPTGFTNSMAVTSLSAYAVGAAEVFAITQIIEGYNIADLGWGAAGAQTVTLSFWVRSSLTGTFGIVLENSANNRSYPATYTISAANTWEQKSITIAGDTSGTWVTNSGKGVQIKFGLGVGSTLSGTAGAWAAADYWGATGATSVVGTNGATLYITGVQLEVGTVATSFDYRSYGTELALCQRYFETNFPVGTAPANNVIAGLGRISGISYATNAISSTTTSFTVLKRATPTMTGYASIDGYSSGSFWSRYSGSWLQASAQTFNSNTYGFQSDMVTTATAGTAYILAGLFTASAEL